MTSAAELRVVDFDGLSMTGTEFEGCFLVDFDITAQFPLEAVLSDAPEDFPTFVRGDPGDKVIPLHVTIRTGGLTQSQVLALINELKDVFSPFRDPVYLRVDDTDGNTRRMLVKSLGLTPWETHTGAYVASLEAMEPIWESDALTTVNVLMSGTEAAGGYDFIITNDGNAMAVPELVSLTGVGSKGHDADFVWKRNLVIAWRSPLEGVDSLGLPYPIDIVDHEWDTGAEVAASELQADGDDIRVLLDGVEIDRYLDDMNTTGTAVWSSIPFQPTKTATIESVTGAASSPADGESLAVDNPEGTAGFPDQGVILLENEAIYYGSRSPFSFDNVERAYWGTTGAVHAAGTTLYWVEHEIVLLTDYTAAANPLARADREPMIDRTLSTNTRHVYGTSDGLVQPGSLRPGQWLRELRGDNLAAPLMGLQQVGGEIVAENTAPTGDRPNFDATALYIPCFLEASVDALVLDYNVQHNMNLEILLVDEGGFETRLALEDVRQGVILPGNTYIAGEPSFNNGATFTPTARSSRITLVGRNRIHTGRREGPSTLVVGVAGDRKAQTFTLDSEVEVQSLCFDGSKDAGSDRDLIVQLVALTSGDPDANKGLSGGVTILTADIPVGGDIPFTVFFSDPLRMPAATYAIIWLRSGGTAGQAQLRESLSFSQYPGGHFFDETAPNVWAANEGADINFNIEGDDAQNQPDADLETGQQVLWRNVDVTLDSTLTPAIVLGARAAMWFFQATLENLTTGQTLTLLYPLEVGGGSVLRLGTQAHTVFPSNGAEAALPSLWAMEPDDLALWLSLEPGANSMRYSEPTIPAVTPGHVDLSIAFRDRWT